MMVSDEEIMFTFQKRILLRIVSLRREEETVLRLVYFLKNLGLLNTIFRVPWSPT